MNMSRKMNVSDEHLPIHQKLAQGKDIGKYGSLSHGAGDFGVSPHLGGRPEVKSASGATRRELTDDKRCCPAPRGGNQANCDHGPSTFGR